MLRQMDDQRVGRALRAIRLHRRRRQMDIARAAGVSQSSISRIERGHLGSFSLDTLRGVAAALEATVDVGVRWRGGEVDRVLGARHAAMSERVVAQLDAVGGWQWAAETSFSAWGERGVIDLLAWHAARRCLLVIELKTELVDPAALLAQVDRYRRLAPAVARERGWAVAGPGTGAGPARTAGPGSVACWVVVAETSSNRARLARHRTLLRGTFPADGRQMAAWLADPRGPALGLTFLQDMRGETGTRLGPVRRVRGRPNSPPTSRPPAVASVADAPTRADQATRDAPRPSRTS
jgi:transcriptional regulator with XRE-family HTH domain